MRARMADLSYFRLQIVVFALVSASFTNIYITQPVLPVLRQEFAADMVLVSFTVSAVVLGMALSNLPFGFLADRLPIHPIILAEDLPQKFMQAASGETIETEEGRQPSLLAEKLLPQKR